MRLSRKTRDAREKRRVQTVLLREKGWTHREIAEALGCESVTVGRVLKRWQEHGEAGLVDRREDNGPLKVDEDYLQCLREILGNTPRDYGWARPTWTLESLVLTAKRLTGIAISPSTMSRSLGRIGARRGRPKPVVACPWTQRKRKRRLREIHRLLEEASAKEIVLYEDEVDIHLNPKIGQDWMLPGQQRIVVTPGKNDKRYLAGALNARTKELTFVSGPSKSSMLFIKLCVKIIKEYPEAKGIHLVLDNYRIHKSRQTERFLASMAKKIHLHFLPPYCPEANRIERTWQNLHANVTRNHSHKNIHGLMNAVRAYLNRFRRASSSTLETAA